MHLKKRASDNNHSLQSELHKMIRSYTHTDLSEFRDLVREVQDEYIAANKTLSDSTELIKSDRER